ncbi:GspE/PulE family protein [Aquisalibacillus elongatus]|uniref:Type IV pilus assembly protein PilB n=1 Tax=Aquisalibacillus elongatus TaxID=485577 RepID=A0A3N5B015_9BACI|nr:GspE/PulE family protein [Aquisalibacillus elongatus]RPF50563.1 type IV pilus assembly protein PilB [Aquisalibacillus elongatus]
MANKVKLRLGEILVQQGLITKEQLNKALDEKKPGQKLGDKLIESGDLTEMQLMEVLQQQLGIPHVRLHNYNLDSSILSLVSKDYARENLVLPLRKENNKLVVAVADPLDYFVFNDLRLSTGFVIDPVMATKDEIRQNILRHYEQEDFSEQFDSPSTTETTEELTIEEESSPVVKLLNQMIQQAVVEKASDIHLDPQEHQLLIRLRIDGALRTEHTLSRNIQSSIITRIKIMASLNITEQKIPQDGRIKRKVEGRDIDMRVSTLPTIFGEKVVIRVLDIDSVSNELSELGFEKEHLNNFINMIEKPHGIVLLTGPTGSGKTSTMYGALTRLNQEESNILTIEDPVEYQLNGINQIQVNPKVDLTFATGLRSMLRQDPDIIMVGEIRDEDTANMAVRASITGHLVLSTLHTNDSVGSIDRLINIGVERFLVGTSLNGVVAQRLVRTICRDCVTEDSLTEREKEIFNKYSISIERIKRGKGCPTCNGTGYKGRTAIHEVLAIDDDIRSAILNNQTSVDIEKIARAKGFTYLFEDGLRKVEKGLTTTEEVLRVAAE